MDPTAEGALLTLLGILIGGLTVFAWRYSEHQLRGPVEPEATVVPAVPAGVGTVLSVLRSSALVLDEEDRVLQASAPAYALGIVRDGRLRVPELLTLVQQVRRDGETRQADLELERGLGVGPTYLAARVAALSSRTVLVLVDDRTRERRVEAIRRDFVANVSHELKTPVGALTLLAEAVEEAAEDPEAVARFAGRMRTEAARLNRLVQQIIELSRLQGDEALDRPAPVDVDRVVAKVIDTIDVEARAKDVEVVFDGRHGLQILGNENQVLLALGNLVSNAVTYSSAHSKVVVTALNEGLSVDLTVADRGVGIPEEELDRIFERFYRVDPARHRSTGGTGLGLSIVKHVAASHGGEVRVWSQPGEGSAFTLSLPRRLAPTPVPGAHARPRPAEPGAEPHPEKENP